jgi:hypothetical protein
MVASYSDGTSKTDYSRGNVSGFFSDVNSQGTSLMLVIAPKVSFKGKYTLSPSVNFVYNVTDVDRTINPKLDTIFDPNVNYHTIGSSAGLLFNAANFYIGYAVNLFNRTKSTNEGVFGNRGFYSDVQMGYTFERNSAATFSFTPQLVISILKDWYTSRILVGLQGYNANFRYKQFIWGVNDGGVLVSTRGNPDKRLPELGGIHIGWQTDKFRVMLTNSYSRNRSYEEFQYAGNLSLRYVLGNSSKPGRSW